MPEALVLESAHAGDSGVEFGRQRGEGDGHLGTEIERRATRDGICALGMIRTTFKRDSEESSYVLHAPAHGETVLFTLKNSIETA